MALTIAYEGLGVIANADALTNDTGGLGTGDWAELGAGTIDLNPDVYLYGSASIGNQYASKTGYSYFDRVTPLDFDTGGAHEGQFIYIWINISSKGAFKTGHSFAIRLGTANNTNYRDFRIADKNDANGWSGGWKLFVLDPTKTGSVTDTGTFDVGSVRYIGLFIDTDVSVRAESIFMSQIAVAKGLRITGTSTNGWAEAVAYCNNYASRAWGVLQEREGIYYVYGGIWIGSTSQGAATSFADSGRVLQFGTSEYYYTPGTAWVTSYPSTANKLVIEDSASYTTTFTDGVIVGSDSGRAGSQIISDPNSTVSLDLYGGNHADSVTALYGTTLKNITGAINSGNDAGHKFLGCNFLGCSRFDPVGAPAIRNCIFAETSATTASLLWNSSIDIQNCKFIANTTGDGIHHTTADSYTYTDLTFSGNTYDILNSTAGTVNISAQGTSNPDTKHNTGGGTINITNDKTLSITVKDENNVAIQGAQVYIQKSATETGEYGHPANPYTDPGSSANARGDLTYVVTQTIEPDNPVSGWLVVKDNVDKTEQTYRYQSKSGSTFTLKTAITGTDEGGGTSTTIVDTGVEALDIVEGDTIYNTDSPYNWATVVSKATNLITTTPLSGGASWASKNYAIHKLAKTYVTGDTATVPLMNEETNASGIASEAYNLGADMDVDIRVRLSTGTTKYFPYKTTATIDGNISVTTVLIEDTIIS